MLTVANVEFVNGHYGIGPSDRSLALASLEADMSVLEIFAILRAGGAVVYRGAHPLSMAPVTALASVVASARRACPARGAPRPVRGA